MKRYYLFSLIYLAVISCYSQKTNGLSNLPSDFGNQCYAHIEELASYGLRRANLKSESKTIGYLKTKLAEAGVEVSVDTFSYNYFNYDSAIVLHNNKRIEFNRLFINPYFKEYELESELFLLSTPIENLEGNLSDKIIIVAGSYNFFDLFKIKAKAIIVVSDSVYEIVEGQKSRQKISLKIFGEVEEYKTFNVLGNSSAKATGKKDIVISAHWDSKIGPGADDNASGISVMLELAKYFNENKNNIPFNIKYIAFGAEELGMLGSQAYFQKHSTELKNCMLNINLDAVGGSSDIMLEIHQASKEDINDFQKLPSTVRFCSGHAEDFKWILLSPKFYALMNETKLK